MNDHYLTLHRLVCELDEALEEENMSHFDTLVRQIVLYRDQCKTPNSDYWVRQEAFYGTDTITIKSA